MKWKTRAAEHPSGKPVPETEGILLEETDPEGPVKGCVVELDQWLPGFYRLRGWDEDRCHTGQGCEAGIGALNMEAK